MHEGTTRVIAVRHGRTAWNAEQRLQGQLDIPLDTTGLWQAERLAEPLARELEPERASGTRITLVSSDLGRCRATAAPTAHRLALPVVLDAGLRERSFGVFEGSTYAEVEARWPAEHERWRRREPGFGPDGGETLADFQIRAVAAASRLAEAARGGLLLLFTHGGVLDALYRAAAGLDVSAPRGWILGNAAINRLLWTGERWSKVGWNDEAHLEGGADGALAQDDASSLR